MDNALGCIVGSLVGDAAGAPLEFNHNIKNNDICNSMNMLGGGMLNIGRGQITDDGELTLALAKSLVNKKYYSLERAAKSYNEWINSTPFDIGSTCRKAFSIQNVSDSYADMLLYNASKYNMSSQANGALMRLTPIPIKFWNESNEVISQIAKYDCMLSHPNQVCLDVNSIYALTLANLIKSKGDNSKVFCFIKDYVEVNISSIVKDWFMKDRFNYLSNDNLAKQNIGHVKHAFCMGMNLLENAVDYETGIRNVLKMGGDTDTNAACCGSILGCINGYSKIPDYMKKPVLTYKYKKEELIGYKRPEIYHASNAIKFVENVFNYQ